MHLETLKLFCDLADSHSFSKTAERHLLSQSAVSQQLAQLELAHKCQLITRRKRPIELTPAGQIFYRAAREILERYDLLKNELHNLATGIDFRINVAHGAAPRPRGRAPAPASIPQAAGQASRRGAWAGGRFPWPRPVR